MNLAKGIALPRETPAMSAITHSTSSTRRPASQVRKASGSRSMNSAAEPAAGEKEEVAKARLLETAHGSRLGAGLRGQHAQPVVRQVRRRQRGDLGVVEGRR